MRKRTPLLYTLHTGELYGMERMALATAWGLRDEFEPVILTPPGPAVSEARNLGFEVIEAADLRAFSMQLSSFLSRHKRLAFFSTTTVHSLVFSAMNLVYRRRAAHIHMVHGFNENRGSVGRRRLLNHLPVTIVAVSGFARQQLVLHGVRDRQIRVIENFLPAERIVTGARREPFLYPGVRRAAVISRLVPLKRIDLLLTCLETRPELTSIAFHIYGTGSEGDALKERVARSGLNVIFEGFRSDVADQLAQADLFVHLCPDEAFGIVVLEAMAAGVPVVAPDRGGTGFVIDDGVTGLHFAANDAASLGVVLAAICQAQPDQLNALVASARVALETRFSERKRVDEYRSLIWASLGTRSDDQYRKAPTRNDPAL
jgi:glycosyltransferase involved in cell wall biosynthesis